nr:MAG TPA: hypothetical protein [Caudoviricetes sp.]
MHSLSGLCFSRKISVVYPKYDLLYSAFRGIYTHDKGTTYTQKARNTK